MTVLVLALTSALIAEVSINKRHALRDSESDRALDLAAQTLVGYALQQPVPGTLPCPDTDLDRLQNVSAGGCQSQLGLLPTRTLGLDRATDGAGADLWYAVELAYVVNAAGERNSSRVGSLTLEGAAMAAIVIAPGQAIGGQNRVALNVTDFLEGVNANGDLTSYSVVADDMHNDRLVGVGVQRFWSSIEARVLAASRALLTAYRTACGEYPWAAPFGGPYTSVAGSQAGALPLATALPFDWGSICPSGTAPVPPGWLATHWADQLLYRMCTVAQNQCVTLAPPSGSSGSGVVLGPGTVLAGQARPSANTADYFEGENIAPPDTRYAKVGPFDHSSTYNDTTQLLSP